MRVVGPLMRDNVAVGLHVAVADPGAAHPVAGGQDPEVNNLPVTAGHFIRWPNLILFTLERSVLAILLNFVRDNLYLTGFIVGIDIILLVTVVMTHNDYLRNRSRELAPPVPPAPAPAPLPLISIPVRAAFSVLLSLPTIFLSMGLRWVGDDNPELKMPYILTFLSIAGGTISMYKVMMYMNVRLQNALNEEMHHQTFNWGIDANVV